MKTRLIAAGLLFSTYGFAAVPIDGWYTQLFGGYSFLYDNVSTFNNAGLLFNNSSYNNGYNAGGRVGYQSHPMRYEGEYTYFGSTNKGFNVDGLRARDVSGGSGFGNLLMANVYYDAPDMLPAISPFLGVGIGYGNMHAELISQDPRHFHSLSLVQNTFTYQGTAGFTFNFSENYAINWGYRYAATAKSGVFGRVYTVHMASAAAIYHFDQGDYK
jgi:opacity protein-like surface antigen